MPRPRKPRPHPSIAFIEKLRPIGILNGRQAAKALGVSQPTLRKIRAAQQKAGRPIARTKHGGGKFYYPMHWLARCKWPDHPEAKFWHERGVALFKKTFPYRELKKSTRWVNHTFVKRVNWIMDMTGIKDWGEAVAADKLELDGKTAFKPIVRYNHPQILAGAIGGVQALADKMKVSASTVRRWVGRGKIEIAGKTPRGGFLFEIPDMRMADLWT